MKIIFSFLVLIISSYGICQEIIPFELKNDNRIYLKVSVNQSDTLNFVFDLGANTTVINKTRLEKNRVSIKFDSIVSNQGANGISNEQISLDNSVRIGDKTYANISILGISYPENDILDGIIAWNFFKNKKVRINYEKGQLTIYDELPKMSEAYSKSRIKFINDVPFVKTIIFKGKRKVKIWAMLDIGYNSELLVYYDEVEKNSLIGQFQVIGESTTSGTDGKISKSDKVLLPKFRLSNFEIYNMPADFTKTKTESPHPALMGGNLLKRFHIVLDFKKQIAYFMPNIYINSKF